MTMARITPPSPSISLIVAIATVLLIQLVLLDVKCDEALVRSTCAKTPEPSFCCSLLLANQSSLTTDVAGLAAIAADLLLSNVTKLQPTVAELAQKATESQLKIVLTDCDKEYQFGIHLAKELVSDLAIKQYSSARSETIGVDDMVSSCQDMFEEFNLTYPPILNQFQQGIGMLHVTTGGIIDLLMK